MNQNLRERISIERNGLSDADLAFQRELEKAGEELRRQRSRGLSSAASSSVASSTSSTYSTSHSAASSAVGFLSNNEEFRKLSTRVTATITDLRGKYDFLEADYSTQTAKKDAQISKKDQEIQRLMAELQKRDETIRQQTTANATVDRTRSLGARPSTEIRQLERKLKETEAETVKKEESYKAELKKRDRAMKEMNKLYETLNLEQDELFKRCNDELEMIAKAAHPSVGVGRGGEDLWKLLEGARNSEGVMRKELAYVNLFLEGLTRANIAASGA